MEGFIRQLLTLPQVQELTAGINGREKHSVVTGLSPVQRAAVAAAAAEQTGRPLLMLCADEQECARQAADLRACARAAALGQLGTQLHLGGSGWRRKRPA